MRDIAREPAFAMRNQDSRLIAGIVDDLNFARLDDEEFHVAVTELDERFPILVMLRRQRGTIGDLRDLGLIQ